MASLYQRGVRFLDAKKEVWNLIDDKESPKALLCTSSSADSDDETRYLSEKVSDSSDDEEKVSKARPVEDQDNKIHFLSEKAPFFDVIITKSHVDPANSLCLPVTVLTMLPREKVLAVLIHDDKKWEVSYTGDRGRPRFVSKWKKFAVDNCLKVGDACVFELIDPSHRKLVFRVEILRGDLPTELQPLVDTRGTTSYAPIVLD